MGINKKLIINCKINLSDYDDLTFYYQSNICNRSDKRLLGKRLSACDGNQYSKDVEDTWLRLILDFLLDFHLG